MSNTLPLPVLEMGPAACLTSIGQPMPQQAASDGFEAALSSAKPGAGKAKTPPSQPDQPEPGGQPSADDTTDPKAAEQQAAPQASLSEPAGQSLPPEPPGTSSEPAKEVRPASVQQPQSSLAAPPNRTARPAQAMAPLPLPQHSTPTPPANGSMEQRHTGNRVLSSQAEPAVKQPLDFALQRGAPKADVGVRAGPQPAATRGAAKVDVGVQAGPEPAATRGAARADAGVQAGPQPIATGARGTALLRNGAVPVAEPAASGSSGEPVAAPEADKNPGTPAFRTLRASQFLVGTGQRHDSPAQVQPAPAKLSAGQPSADAPASAPREGPSLVNVAAPAASAPEDRRAEMPSAQGFAQRGVGTATAKLDGMLSRADPPPNNSALGEWTNQPQQEANRPTGPQEAQQLPTPQQPLATEFARLVLSVLNQQQAGHAAATIPPSDQPGTPLEAPNPGRIDVQSPQVQVPRPGGPVSVVPDEVNLDRIVRVARTNIGERDSQVTLQLHPPELGRLRIEVRLQDDLLTLRIEADNGAVRDMLTSRSGELRRALELHGIAIDRFDVDLRQATAHSSQSRESQNDSAWRPAQDQAQGGQSQGDGGRPSESEDAPGYDGAAAGESDPEAEEAVVAAATESAVDVMA